MEDYNNKTKAELLEIIQNLEKKVEQLSSESASGRKERFRDRYSKRILDNLPDMLTVLDRNANIVELVSSPSTNHVEGTTADSITQSNIKDILPEDAYNNIRRNMEKVFSTGNSAIARHDLMQDGVSHHYEHWLSLLDKEYLLCMCRDVSQLWETEQTNAEQQNEIMRLNSLMQAIVNNVPVYLFVKDSGNDFRYLYWNKTFADYSGIPIEKAIGRNDFEIFKRTEDMEKFHLDDMKVLKEGKLDYFEEYMTATGEIRTITTMKRLVPSNNGHPYIIGISWDITEIKKTEKALDAARIKAEEADRLKSAFLANMSHGKAGGVWGILMLLVKHNTHSGGKKYGSHQHYQGKLCTGSAPQRKARTAGLLGQLVRSLPDAEPRGGRSSRRAHRCKGGQGERGRAAGSGGAVRGNEHPHPAGIRAGQAGASGCGRPPQGRCAGAAGLNYRFECGTAEHLRAFRCLFFTEMVGINSKKSSTLLQMESQNRSKRKTKDPAQLSSIWQNVYRRTWHE